MPNVERLVFMYLRGVGELDALVDERIFTAYDESRGFPQVVVTRVAGSADQYHYLDRPRLQIEVWADKGDRPLAHEVMQVVRAAMSSDEIVGTHDLGVVTKSEEANMLFLPDQVETGGTARPRYILDIRLWVHPSPDGDSLT